ncbi:uncharacterized protein with the myosin-like domain [Halothece sp. PCC 7418]|uniref:DUF3084 domain-containing protein n=1 Tax=Halothece sp. (strain PCC 7418) TaxID=65093 RepID=UPI0002A07924|nr:DUF3084 domain-containing protein [Halothece sp. PCC 7418]AFZ43396.1 uncharacterized protein with the myosin-like domain [Halothece sp. PCC 7418]
MMTSALVLIAAILLLGGLLAALGDYLGTKVGKARLRMFHLRPRQTATLVTIFTGTLIAASTLGILFATSESLRKGIFRLDEYLNRLQDARDELAEAVQEKEIVKQELAKAQQGLDQVNRKFQITQQELTTVSQNVKQLNQQLSALKQEREKLLEQRKRLEQEIIKKDEELARQKEQLQVTEERLENLKNQRQKLQTEIKKQDQRIAELDQNIQTRDEVLQFQEEEVTELETQLVKLQEKIQALEQYYQNYQALRRGNVALGKGEVLALRVVQINDLEEMETVINQMLRQANRNAIQATQPGNENFQEQVLVITQSQIKRLKEILKDGQEYVVQIVTAGNYLSGEKKIRVFTDVIPNQQVFQKGELIASLSLSPQEVQQGELSGRINLLLAASRFRARRSGVVGKIFVGESNVEVIRFIEELETLNQPYNQINAIAAQKTDTAGPLQLKLRVMQDDKVILSH